MRYCYSCGKTMGENALGWWARGNLYCTETCVHSWLAVGLVPENERRFSRAKFNDVLRHILSEGMGYNIWEDNWNPMAHSEPITISIADLRQISLFLTNEENA